MKTDSKYLIGLDLLRCLLAISILLFHFYHFSTPYDGKGYADKSELPFFWLLSPLYSYGGFAVEIFWLISGIIFSHFYLEIIQSKKMDLKEFLFLRFSRLYPLHFITLVSVALLQIYYSGVFNDSFIYENNDSLHFILNLFMINFWNAKFGLSFNGPFWSVSVEMFVYIVFFSFAALQIIRNNKFVLGIIIAFFMSYCLGIFSPFYECLLYFFTGCLIYRIVSILNKGHLIMLAICILVFTMIKFYSGLMPENLYLIRSIDALIKLLIAAFIVLVFSRLFRNTNQRLKVHLRTIGNMTYAVYMIHISVEMILILLFNEKGKAFFNSQPFFISYLAGVLLLGFLSYRYFEIPVQKKLRNIWHDKSI